MNRRTRVRFVEPSLAHYRVPFFRALAARPDISLRLFYAESGRVNASPDGFAATFAARKTLRLAGQPVYWQAAQLDAVDGDSVDVVSFDWDVHYASLVPALLKAKRQGVGTILWGHGTSGNDGTWKAWPRLALARLADVLVTYSPTARQTYIDRGWSADRVYCAPNAIDQQPIQQAYRTVREGHATEADAVAAVRQVLELDPAGPVLLFASRLDAVRRLDVLVDAAAFVVRKYPALQVVLVGDGPERETIARRAQDSGLAAHVRFVGGEYDEHRLATWYAAADIVVHPAWLGLSVYHAMGHGRPVVTGDDMRFHPPEAASVVHEVTGLRFPHADVSACAAAIERLLADDGARHRLGRAARERAIRDHSIEAMVTGFRAAIDAAARARL